jgi:hypothetical protein
MGSKCSTEGELINVYKIMVESVKGRKRLEHRGVDKKIILKCVLNKLGVRSGVGFIWLRRGTDGGLL